MTIAPPTPDHRALAALLRGLAPIPDSELAPMLRLFLPAAAPRGAWLLRAGEVPQTLAFLASGLARLFYSDEGGGEWTKSFCDAGELVAGYSALLLGEPARLSIQTLEDSRLLVADYRDYRALCERHPCWQAVNRAIAELLFIKKEQREAALLLDDAETRYAQFLSDYPGLAGRVRQQHIASYLGITAVALSRIRARRRRLT